MSWEIRVFQHYGLADRPHWHTQFVRVGDRALVPGDCLGGMSWDSAIAEGQWLQENLAGEFPDGAAIPLFICSNSNEEN